MATATAAVRSNKKQVKTNKPQHRVTPETKERARSPLVRAILESLHYKRWTSAEDLTKEVGKIVDKEWALEVWEYRVNRIRKSEVPVSEKKQIARGRALQVMLTCITLVQHEKIEQQGRGKTKEYRLK